MKKMKHKVSIIVPAYNCAGYIHRTVSCLLAQTYERIEIIIVNDGSTDDTAKKLTELAGNEPSIFVITQNNSGVSNARNAGISIATGDYIMFMDADDEVKENWVESAVQAMEQDQVDIAAGGYYVADMETGLEDSRSSFSDGVFSREQFIERVFRHRDILPAVWNKIFRTEIIKEHQLCFDSKYAVGEDLLFLVQYCIHIKKAYIFGEHTYCYYINAGGAMNAHQSEHEFKESWLTEWYSVLAAEKLLADHGIEVNDLLVKKVRIADKLLSIIERYRYETPAKKEMLCYLRSHVLKTVWAKEFGVRKKVSIFLSCISPALKRWLNRS